MALPDLHRRTLDVAVKNSGGFLSRDKGLLGKVRLYVMQFMSSGKEDFWLT